MRKAEGKIVRTIPPLRYSINQVIISCLCIAQWHINLSTEIQKSWIKRFSMVHRKLVGVVVTLHIHSVYSYEHLYTFND